MTTKNTAHHPSVAKTRPSGLSVSDIQRKANEDIGPYVAQFSEFDFPIDIDSFLSERKVDIVYPLQFSKNMPDGIVSFIYVDRKGGSQLLSAPFNTGARRRFFYAAQYAHLVLHIDHVRENQFFIYGDHNNLTEKCMREAGAYARALLMPAVAVRNVMESAAFDVTPTFLAEVFGVPMGAVEKRLRDLDQQTKARVALYPGPSLRLTVG